MSTIKSTTKNKSREYTNRKNNRKTIRGTKDPPNSQIIEYTTKDTNIVGNEWKRQHEKILQQNNNQIININNQTKYQEGRTNKKVIHQGFKKEQKKIKRTRI
jgi:hypothetical protein